MKYTRKLPSRVVITRWLYVSLGIILIGAAVSPPQVAYAASITVTTTADTIDAAGGSCASVTLASLPGPDGQTSLREAVCAANANAGADTITFSVNGTFVLTGAANEDNGGSGDLDVKQSLTVQGNGQTNTIIDGGGIERIFDVFPSAASTFDLTNLTLQNGDTRATSFKEGGAIYLHNNVTSSLTNCLITNNFSGANGAIENRGNLTISTSVISNNQTNPATGSVTGGGIHNAGTLTINNTTISNNSVRGEGGGIATTTGAAVIVTISNSTISGNTASVTGGGLGNGGGMSTTGNQGTININDSTISGNHADNNGGGVYFVTPGGGTGNATLTNVTFTNNTADNDNNGAGGGGGFAQNTAAITLRNTIVAGNFNSVTSVRDDISGAVVAASSYNLIGDGTGSSGITNGVNNNQVGSSASPINPQLGLLANNGGSTQTHALLLGSPAINTANNANCSATDQRGFARPNGGICDIGAYEFENIPPTSTSTNTATNTPTNTPVPPTNTATNTPTNTPVPPTNTATNTPTNTSVPPTNTATNTPTNTPVPPTNTATDTPTNTPVVPTNTATDTPTNTPVAPTNTATATATNTPTTTPTNTPTPTGPTGSILLSSNENGEVPGLKYRDEDIIAYNPATQQWSMVFDGSNVGLGNTDIDDFALLSDGSILLSVEKDMNLAGFGPVGDEDVLKFTPTSLGLNNTRGTFSLYFDGSQHGLEADNNNEDIKALDQDSSGILIVSPHGPFNALGVKGENEDLFTFDPGTATWTWRFDGSDVKLDPDLRAVWVDAPRNDLYLAVDGKFKVTGSNGKLSGDGNDIFICHQTGFGANTICAFSLYKDMGSLGMGKNKIDGLAIGTLPVNLLPANVQASGTIQDGVAEVVDDDVDEPSLPDSGETDDSPPLSENQLFLPFVQR